MGSVNVMVDDGDGACYHLHHHYCCYCRRNGAFAKVKLRLLVGDGSDSCRCCCFETAWGAAGGR